MIYYIIKIILSACLIVLVSEVAKRNSLAGALLASLPLVSILAFVWIYLDTGDMQKVSELSRQIFWLVIPSLVLFLALPVFIKNHFNFYLGLSLSMALTAGAYFVLVWILKAKNIQI